MMTYDRVARSFAERFANFADQLKLLATGFCLPSRSMFFGTASYGEEEVNVAYRDIEVRYQFGWQAPCSGRYIPITEIEQRFQPATSSSVYRPPMPVGPLPQEKQPVPPEEGLKPFLNAPLSAPAN